jgi:hypothetical protein
MLIPLIWLIVSGFLSIVLLLLLVLLLVVGVVMVVVVANLSTGRLQV